MVTVCSSSSAIGVTRGGEGAGRERIGRFPIITSSVTIVKFLILV